MTRGRKPILAQEEANLIAEKRGIVQHFLHERGLVCDFTIMSPERITFGRFAGRAGSDVHQKRSNGLFPRI